MSLFRYWNNGVPATEAVLLIYRTMRSLIPGIGIRDDSASQSIVLLFDEIPHFVRDDNVVSRYRGREAGAFRARFD